MPGIPATRSPFDLTIDGVGLMMYRDPSRPKQFAGSYLSAVEGEDFRHRDVPILWDSAYLGFGYSRRWGPRGGYAWAEGVDTRSPHGVVPAGALEAISFPDYGGVTCTFEYGGHLYACTGEGYVIKFPSKTGTPSLETYFGANVSVTAAVVFDNKVYVASVDGSDAPNNLRQWDGTTWTELAGIPAARLAKVTWFTADNVPLMRMVRTDTHYTVKHLSTGADPSVSGNWSAAIKVGDTTHKIIKLLASSRHVFALRADGIHDITAFGESPNLSPYWGDVTDSVSGQAGIIHNGRAIVSHAMGLDSVELLGERQDTPNWCQPGYLLPNETPIQGRVTALVVESGWVVAAVANPANGNSYVMYGKPRSEPGVPDGPGPFVWHGALAVITGSSSDARYVTHMCVVSPSATTSPAYLYIFSTNSTTPQFHRMSLPKAGTPLTDWTSGGPHRFQETGTLYLPSEDWESPSARKFLWRYEATADNLGGTRRIDVYANLDRAGWVRQGQMTSSPRVAFRAVSGGAAYHVGHYLDFRGSPEQPPIWRSLQARAEVAVQQSDVRTYSVLFGAGVALRDGTEDRRDPSNVWARVLGLMQREPVAMTDQYGRIMTVRVLQGIAYQSKEEQADHWSIRADLVVRVLAYQWAWGDGTTYDSDATWG